MASRTLTPANQITILRLVFVPLLAILVMGRHYAAGLAVLLAAAVSDALDGKVARIFKQETPLGIALDPIADKFLMTIAYLTLAFRGALPWWITILVLSRDAAILITALLIILVAGYRPFHPTLLGKAATVFQVATVFMAMSWQARVPLVAPISVRLSIYLTAVFTVASGIHYLVISQRRYDHSSPEAVVTTPAATASSESRSRRSA